VCIQCVFLCCIYGVINAKNNNNNGQVSTVFARKKHTEEVGEFKRIQLHETVLSLTTDGGAIGDFCYMCAIEIILSN